MRPELKRRNKYKGFNDYYLEFLAQYGDQEIVDPLGNVVIFVHAECEMHCLHICYGGSAAHWGHPEHWKQERAERIGWIRRAIERPSKIHPDKDYQGVPRRIKYLLYLPPDDASEENEFYCVIAEFVTAKRLILVTAYNIDRDQYRQYCDIAPCLYPVKEKKNRKKKKD